MASDPVFSTHDLRNHAIAKQREKDHRVKYRNFNNASNAIRDQFVGTDRDKTKFHAPYADRERVTLSDHNKLRNAIRGSNRNDIDDVTPAHLRARKIRSTRDPGSSDEEASEGSDAGLTYSYDAASGPKSGNEILGLALTKAVEKFQKKELEKLVRDEYDVVDDIEHDEVAEDDDFELV